MYTQSHVQSCTFISWRGEAVHDGVSLTNVYRFAFGGVRVGDVRVAGTGRRRVGRHVTTVHRVIPPHLWRLRLQQCTPKINRLCADGRKHKLLKSGEFTENYQICSWRPFCSRSFFLRMRVGAHVSLNLSKKHRLSQEGVIKVFTHAFWFLNRDKSIT